MKWSIGPVVVRADDDLEDTIRGHDTAAAALADKDARVRVDLQLGAVIAAASELRVNLGDEQATVQVTASGYVADDDDGEWSATVTLAGIADAPA